MSPPLNPEQTTRVERHTQLVAKLARCVARGGAALLSVEELESVGNEALVRCALRYDPSSEATFATYAHYRVRGAMIDALRKRTPGRRKHKRAIARLEATQALLGQAAEDRDALRASGQLRSLEQRVETARALVRRAAISVRLSEPDGRALASVAADAPDPEQLLLDADSRAQMWTLVDSLDTPQREIIDAFYVRGQSMGEIAKQLGTSKATVSRRHARIIDELGKRARAKGVS